MIHLLFIAGALATSTVAVPPIFERTWTLDSGEELKEWVVEATGEAKKRMPAPKIEEKRMILLDSWWKSTGAAATPLLTKDLGRVVELEWSFVMNTGTEGMGFAWVDVAKYGDSGVPAAMTAEESPDPGGNTSVELAPWGWEAPSLRRAFGIGLDASDPVNRDPFRGSGNIYDRPQHEVSLHWDGMEIVKRMTPKDFRDEKPHRLKARVEFATGGADVSVWIDGEAMWERYFISGMTAYAGRAVFGARNGESAGDVAIDDVRVGIFEPIAEPTAPVTVAALSRVLNDGGHGENAAEVEFPEDLSAYGRIIATLRLDKPETRFDPWDRSAHLWVERQVGGETQRVELLRYITPYHRGFEWKVDVSDFRPLLSGARRIIQTCSTQGEGWMVSVKFDFYPGPPSGGRVAREVIPLWCGEPPLGEPEKPVTAFYTPRDVTLPEWATAAKVRMVVTGHGMSPNAKNAAEFMSIDRTLTINGTSSKNTLWKADNYLNPCRPQGGTWKYDRAGWAPGDVVKPWEVEAVIGVGEADRKLHIEYALEPYENDNRGKTWAPFHLTHSAVIVYERAP